MNRFWIMLTLAFFIVALPGCGAKPEPKEESKHELADEEMPAEEESGSHKMEEEAPAPTGAIPINTVTADQLASYKITGLAIKTAEKIIEYRDANGPFTSYEDLDKAPRVGEKMLDKLKDHGVDFGSAGAAAEEKKEEAAADAEKEATSEKKPAAPSGKLVNLNKASVEELDALKGISPKQAQAIVDYRKEKGPYKTIDDLDNVKGFGPATIDKIRDLVSVE